MNDAELKRSIVAEFEFEPSINATHIGVAVENGVVTLTGRVSTFAEKVAAERVALRVRGVRALAQEIVVRYPEDKKTSDDEIAERALKVIGWHAGLPGDAIKVKVQHGLVTLSGTVAWQYERAAAEAAVRKFSGVVGVFNTITLRPALLANASEVEHRIRDALQRNAELEADDIHVAVTDGHTVRLEGKVHAWRERSMAEHAAWSVQGVTKVDDRIVVV
jgi:osmotically-inducible protein OsmY